MSTHLVSFFATVLFLFAGTFSPDKANNNHLAVGSLNCHQITTSTSDKKELTQDGRTPASDYPSNGAISDPIEIDWQVLINIDYELRYFKELDMEMYDPVFSKAVEALDGKEVIIEGYIIPFEVEEELLTLSLNPYASCFFCGNASPASVISLYLKEKGQRYKTDDFKKFRGTLYLNYDDPNEFYYILRDAEEV